LCHHPPATVDASGYAVGAELSQEDAFGNERPVAFFSRKLTGKEGLGQRGWAVREQETYGLIAALLKFHSWLSQNKIHLKVQTDHKSLEHWKIELLGEISLPT
jgi:hypothetical protein